MIIEAIQLNNIKSHKNTKIKFQKGINVILGNNGSGKSTIIQAIELTLFNINPSPNERKNLKNFIRKGSNKGEIRLTVSKDDKKYVLILILSKTGKRYSLNVYNTNDEEISDNTQFIKENLLGINDSENPQILFENILGSKQGLLDKPFMLSKQIRKDIFDKMLKIFIFRELQKKVDEINKTITEKFITEKGTIATSLKDRLLNFPSDLESNIKKLKNDLSDLKSKNKNLEIEILKKEKEQLLVQEKERKKEIILNNLKTIPNSIKEKEKLYTKLLSKKTEKEKSKEFLTENKEEYDLYSKLVKELELLYKEKLELDKIKTKVDNINKSINKLHLEKENLNKLNISFNEEIKKNNLEISKEETNINDGNKVLNPSNIELKAIEKKLDVSYKLLNDIEKIVWEMESLIKRFHNIDEEINLEKNNLKKINLLSNEKLKELEQVVDKETNTENNILDLGNRLEVSKFDLKNKKDFLKKIHNNLCPIFNTQCPLSEKDNLYKFIQDSITKIESEISNIEDSLKALKKERKAIQKVKKELEKNNENKIKYENINNNINKLMSELVNEINQILMNKSDMEKIINNIHELNYNNEKLFESIKQIEEIYKNRNCINNNDFALLGTSLNIPNNLLDYLKKMYREIDNVKLSEEKKQKEISNTVSRAESQIESSKKNIKNLQNNSTEKEKKIKKFIKEINDIENNIKIEENNINELKLLFSEDKYININNEYTDKLSKQNELQEIYKNYIKHEAIYKQSTGLEDDIENTIKKISSLKNEKNDLEEKLKTIDSEGIESKKEKINKQLNELKNENKTSMLKISKKESEIDAMKKQLQEIKSLKLKLKSEEIELDKYKKTKEIINRITTKVLKKTGSLIAKEIINKISFRAEKIYSTLAPEENRRLIWSSEEEDIYTLKLQSRIDSSDIIDVANLSGGQLMSASLSIRLSLMSMYSDIGIGFLDEPTIFLDKERRRNLAMTMSENLINTFMENKNWFKQLFIISHDESFYNIGASEIRLELDEDNTSRVL